MGVYKYLTMIELKNGDQVEVFRVSPISENIEVSNYLKNAVNNGIKAGICSNKTKWDDKKVGAIVMTKNNIVIGIISYHLDPDTGNNKLTLKILMGHITPEYREIGAYGVLHRELEKFAIEKKYDGILSYVRIKNKHMMDMLKTLKKDIFIVGTYRTLSNNNE